MKCTNAIQSLFFFIGVEIRMRGFGPLSPLVQDSASSSSSDASFASVLGNTCPRAAVPPHSAFTDSTRPGDDRQTLKCENDMFLTADSKSELT